jgi:AcrR family transcriptional regulator
MGGHVTEPKRRRLKSEERRQEFVARAIELFAEDGFESSTRGLARALGVTQPLLYRYFPSKEDLVAEVYRTVFLDRWQSEWEVLLGDRSRPLRDRLVEFYNSYVQAIYDRTWLRIYLHSGLNRVDTIRAYMGLVRRRVLERIVTEARAEAGLPETPPRDDEVELVWIIHGGLFYHGVRALIFDNAASSDREVMIRDAVEALVCGMHVKLSREA